ncbi:helix-turn-helix transcriptional regulator [Ostreiculturibacter nitratireducens]|uniref:helix-turn-helix transcriptional regulator n=1 Tax=Ostreiculturibacter nitratireducens TaxID=3075226 RepID=UPI0031B5AFD6
MSRSTGKSTRTQGAALVALMAVQSFCWIFFLADVSHDVLDAGIGVFRDWHLLLEIAANLGLFVGIVFEAQYLKFLLRRQAEAERSLSAASGALHELMESYFAEWHLTPAEAEVATFTMKGFSIAEIAEFRGSAEGTVKTHLNAIYRKAGVPGRAQLVNLLIEELMRGPIVKREAMSA